MANPKRYSEKISRRQNKPEFQIPGGSFAMQDNFDLIQPLFEPHFQSLFAGGATEIHAKFEISHPQDQSEIQADEFAGNVLKGNTGKSQSVLEKNATDINTKGEGSGLNTTPQFDSQLQSTKGQGNKLDSGTKTELESHTGTDLSGVNVHSNHNADNLSSSINAKAFTHGQDIYFKSGNYNTSSPEGKSLLAHEVAHTVQQGNQVSKKEDVKIHRSIDQEASVRIAQYRLDKLKGISTDVPVTGDKKDIPADIKDKYWPDDMKLLEILFTDLMGVGVGSTKGIVKAIKASVDGIFTEFETSAKAFEANLAKNSDFFSSKDSILKTLPEILDLETEAEKELNKGPITDKQEFSNKYFGMTEGEIQADIAANKKIKSIIAEPANAENLERYAKSIFYNIKLLEQLLPQEVVNAQAVKDAYTLLNSGGGKPGEGGFFVNGAAITPSNVNTMRQTFKNRIQSHLPNIKAGNPITSNQATDFSIIIGLFQPYEFYIRVGRAMKTTLDGMKNIDSDEYAKQTRIDRIEYARPKSHHAIEMDQLITLVEDYMDVDRDASNILTIHYDYRVNDIKTEVTDTVAAHIAEAAKLNLNPNVSAAEKIILNKKVMAVVLFETGNLKTIKLGIEAFDNPTLMIEVIKAAIALPDPVPNQAANIPNKKKSKKKNEPLTVEPVVDPIEAKVDDNKLNITAAIDANKLKFPSIRSARIIQQLTGAPLTGIFDKITEKYIYEWQSSTGEIIPKAEGGVIRDKDMERFFTMLTVDTLSFNSMIHLALDYYGLYAEMKKIPKNDYTTSSDKLQNENLNEESKLYTEIFYKKDALEAEEATDAGGEAAVTSGLIETPIATVIKMGEGSFSSLNFMVYALVHEILHAHQFASGSSISGDAKELDPYLSGVKGKFGGKDLPTLPSGSVAEFMANGVKYYFKIDKMETMVSFRSTMKEFVDEARVKEKEYITEDDKKELQKIKKKENAANAVLSADAKQGLLLSCYADILKTSLPVIDALNDVLTAPENTAFPITLGNAYTSFTTGTWTFTAKLDYGNFYSELVPAAELNAFYTNVKTGLDSWLVKAIAAIDAAILKEEDKDKKKSLQDSLNSLKGKTGK